MKFRSGWRLAIFYKVINLVRPFVDQLWQQKNDATVRNEEQKTTMEDLGIEKKLHCPDGRQMNPRVTVWKTSH